MRRKDREVTDPLKIKEVISNCQCCRLGLCDEGDVYIVPMSFGFEEQDGHYTLYFHSAAAGRKIDLMKRNPHVGFEMDTSYELHLADTACECGCAFQSVIGSGKVTFLEDKEEKTAALKALMKQTTGREDWAPFQEDMLKVVCVFKLDVEELACKIHL